MGKTVEIRRLWLNNRPTAYGLRISERDVEIIKRVKQAKSRGLTSHAIVKKYGMTIHGANSILRTLCDKGYLQRTKVTNAHGEYKFKYWLNDALKD